MPTYTERVVVLMDADMVRDLAERVAASDVSRAALVRGCVALEREVRQIADDCLRVASDEDVSADYAAALRFAAEALGEAHTRTMGSSNA